MRLGAPILGKKKTHTHTMSGAIFLFLQSFFLASLFSIPGNEAVSDASCMSTCGKICSLVARMI